MRDQSPSGRAENQSLIRQEQELKLEVVSAKLRAAKAEYKLALLELVLADPSLAPVCAEVFRRDTGEELFSESVHEQVQQEPSHAAKE